MTKDADSRRRARCCSALAALTLIVALAGSASASVTRDAQALRNCPLPNYPGVGYFTSLMVSGTSCATGKQVAIAYYHCRIKHGGAAGRCPGGVLGFSCSEHRVSIPTEIDARVTCVRHDEKVVHTYQQDT
jgi:hypothetical protein